MAPRLPEKIYFKIGEVSEIVGVEPYVLRYWETEFDLLKPSKAPSNHRLYKKRDVELLLEIKRLLYTEGFHDRGRAKETERNEERRKEPAQTAARRTKIQKRPGQIQKRPGIAAAFALLIRGNRKILTMSKFALAALEC